MIRYLYALTALLAGSGCMNLDWAVLGGDPVDAYDLPLDAVPPEGLDRRSGQQAHSWHSKGPSFLTCDRRWAGLGTPLNRVRSQSKRSNGAAPKNRSAAVVPFNRRVA